MKNLLDDVPLCKLRMFIRSKFTKRGLAFLVGAIVLPVNLAVAEPAAQPYGSDSLMEVSSLISLPTVYQAPVEKMTVTATAYNSLEGQTDDSPCFAARGYNLCEADEENVIAANFLALGTKVSFPELYGDKIFTVVDRMNARYSKYCTGTSCHIDFWMRTKADARKFGKQTVEMVILSHPEF